MLASGRLPDNIKYDGGRHLQPRLHLDFGWDSWDDYSPDFAWNSAVLIEEPRYG